MVGCSGFDSRMSSGNASVIKQLYGKLRSRWANGLLKPVRRQDPPERLVSFHCCRPIFDSGVGLEIGGPSGMFRPNGFLPVYPLAARIDNCTFDSQTVWQGEVREGETYVFDSSKPPGRQYIVEGSDLHCIADAAYDFVLSSHCIEHLANPLKGLSEWIRVLRRGGLLALIIPHKDGTFDHRRPVTALRHLIEDFENQTDEGDRTHLPEILSLHDLSKDPGAGDFASFRKRSERNVENRCLHHHVFDTRLAVDAVDHMGLQIEAVELFKPYHIAILARKAGRDQPTDNQRFRGVGGAPCWTSPFPSDHALLHCRGKSGPA